MTTYIEQTQQRYDMMALTMIEHEKLKIKNIQRRHKEFEEHQQLMSAIKIQHRIELSREREKNPTRFLEATGSAHATKMVSYDTNEVYMFNEGGRFDGCRLVSVDFDNDLAVITVNDPNHPPFWILLKVTLSTRKVVATGRIERHEAVPSWHQGDFYYSITNIRGRIENAAMKKKDDGDYVIDVSDSEFPKFSLSVLVPASLFAGEK